MKFKSVMGWSAALCLSVGTLQAQQSSNQVEQLQKQLQQLQESFEKVVREQREQIECLTRQVNALQQQQAAPPPSRIEPSVPVAQATNVQPTTASTAEELKKPAWSPADPIRIGSSSAYLGMSLDALFAGGGMNKPNEVPIYEPGGHDPKQNGFTVQNLELIFDGKVDPYFQGQVNINFQISPDGETGVELEEAWLQTLSLPLNLQLKAGQMLTAFGRLNQQHPHAWDFVDVSLVNARFLGPDGLRNPGVQASWLAPTPFYSELFFSAQNSSGETAYSFGDTHEGEIFLNRLAGGSGTINQVNDLLYTARYAASFDLTDEQTVVLGGSGAFGPNSSGEDTRTQIYGVDMFYKWKSARHNKGFPFVTWQTEWMYRNYQAAAFQLDEDGDGQADVNLPEEALSDWGLYSQVCYGFMPRWVVSFRGDYLNGGSGAMAPTVDNDRRWRISPAITWYPSEFSKLRLQYNHDDFQTIGPAWGIWLQWEFLLGAHSAHKF